MRPSPTTLHPAPRAPGPRPGGRGSPPRLFPQHSEKVNDVSARYISADNRSPGRGGQPVGLVEGAGGALGTGQCERVRARARAAARGV